MAKDIDLSSPENVNFIPYNEVNTVVNEGTVMGWGATLVKIILD